MFALQEQETRQLFQIPCMARLLNEKQWAQMEILSSVHSVRIITSCFEIQYVYIQYVKWFLQTPHSSLKLNKISQED